MESTGRAQEHERFQANLTPMLQILLLLMLLFWCVQIVTPLLVPVIWGLVLAVSLEPLHRKLCTLLGGRKRLAAGLLSCSALALMLLPSGLFLGSMLTGATDVATGMRDGTITIPAPPASVADWPLIGEPVAELWSTASRDAASIALEYSTHLKGLAAKLMGAVAGVGFGIVGFAFSLVLAGVFLAIGKPGGQLARAIAVRLLGEGGHGFIEIIVGTIRSVAQGVLGVAVIQALLIGLGLVFMGVPGAGLWTLLCLILGIAQLPLILVSGPLIFYVFQGESAGTASIFAVWMVLASISDMFLKPLFLGRGLDVPMPIILVGSIGGMLAFGILGLFLGAVILAIVHRLFVAWVKLDADAELDGDGAASTPG